MGSISEAKRIGIKAGEMMESWVNGNRSWVRDQIWNTKRKRIAVILALEVYERLQENYSQTMATEFKLSLSIWMMD